MDVSNYIFIDQHCHPWHKRQQQLDLLDFRRSFSESRSVSQIQEHMPTSLYYLDMLNQLGELVGASGEQDIFALRQTLDEKEYINDLFDSQSIGGLIVDDGYSTADSMSLPEMSSFCQRPIWRCLRIERVLEDAVLKANTFEELKTNFESGLTTSSSAKVVSLKTIAGYRGGLELKPIPYDAAHRDFDSVKAKFAADKMSGTPARISSGPLYHYFLLQAFEIAGALKLPVQVHTGIGDDDADLRATNPLNLREIFQSERFTKTNFVLLHCYPYTREAGYLCSIYPNVYMDLSLSIVFASAYARVLLEEALCMAPPSKICAASDGHDVPESHWYGALSWKRALSMLLSRLVSEEVIHEDQAHDVAARILHDNARSLYNLEGLA